jgi:hypothetical protein
MSIAFACTGCGKSFKVKDELAGRKAKCTCGQVVTVPIPEPEPAAAEALEEDIFSFKDEPVAAAPMRVAQPAVAAVGASSTSARSSRGTIAPVAAPPPMSLPPIPTAASLQSRLQAQRA